MNNLQNILLIRTDRIGDVVLTLPVAQIIKEHFPKSKITFLLREYTKPLAEENPNIDEVITLEDFESSYKKLLKKIKEKNFDAAIIFSPNFEIARTIFSAKIKNRIGTGYRWYSFLFNKKIYEHRKYGTKHELEHNIEMLKAIGIMKKYEMENVSFNIQSDAQNKQITERILSKTCYNSSKKTIIIHPGSGGSAIDLPISKFIELTNLLAYNLDVNLIVTGSEKEKELCKKFEVNEKIINLSGKLTLKNFIALIEMADILVANSTGPIHIAAALKKYVVGFYPTLPECSEVRWGPYTKNKTIFSPECNIKKPTRKEYESKNFMTKISVDKIFKSIIKTCTTDIGV